MSARPVVLILGAAGRFGAAAVHAFAAAGWRVLAQQRRLPAAPQPPNVEPLDIPLERTDALAARAAAATIVVYAVNPLYTRWDSELMPLFHQGLAIADRLGARFMIPGNVYNYGQGMPPLLAVDSPALPTTRKGEQRVAMESELGRRGERGLAGVVIRAGDFYGAGSGSWFDQAIAKSIAAGKLVYPGPLDVDHAWAYLPDLARAFVAVAGRPHPGGFVRLHFAGHTATGRQLLAAIDEAAQALGLRPAAGFRTGDMPWLLMRFIGWVNPMLRELSRMRYLWQVPHRIDGVSLEHYLGGPLPGTPLVTALQRSLEALPFSAGRPGLQQRRRHPAAAEGDRRGAAA